MSATMKKAVLHAPHDMRIEEVPVPELEPGDVLIKVTGALLCGTDVRIYTGRKTRNVSLPSTLGHELAGEVADASGPLPEGVHMHDQVCVYPLVPCGNCAACLKGHPNICRNRVAFGYQLDGGLSQYVRVPAAARDNLIPINNVSALEAAIVEPVACALNGQNLAKVAGADTVLVAGAGPLGLIHIRLAKAQGVKTVISVEPNTARHTIAADSGADVVLTPDDDVAERIRQIAPDGVDVVIMAIGRPEALTPYLGVLAPGARISVFAGFNSDAVLELVANDIHYNEYEIVGASSCRLENFQQAAPMINDGRLKVADLIGTQLPLARAAEAIDLAASGSDMRVGVDVWA
ncbi:MULTISPECIES: alcohol dehydrogenase catalytic domain-containing protein [Actinomyces]|uniref:Alcohol dehydrogenase catalytic domain-containing protein n=1 Tax=Actinomyces respiraculi TaxID=2744574 RepID=A0A7T0PXZ9_9ACTO|nr:MULTISPECIES: alcohol dehydrogenase catalytic domain-containing protein [Actinomyces]QPL06145.1 alcohol dehydrogenase catalytic domain-containing protein [Actinomyces respiraculi]